MPVPRSPAAPTALSPGDIARRDDLYNELYRVDHRLEELHRDRIRVGGPITMMVLGYSTLLISGSVALSTYGSAEQIDRGEIYNEYDEYDLDFNDDGDVDKNDERNYRRAARISAGVAGAGLAVGLLGTVRLVQRVALRRERADEERKLQERHRSLRQQLDYSASVAPGQLQLHLQGHF